MDSSWQGPYSDQHKVARKRRSTLLAVIGGCMVLGVALGLAIGGMALLKAGPRAGEQKGKSQGPSASEMEGDAIVEGILRQDGMQLEQLAQIRDPSTAQRAGDRISKLTGLRADAKQLWEDYCRRASPDLVKPVAAKHEGQWQQLDEPFRIERSRIEAIPAVRDAASALWNHENIVQQLISGETG